MLVSDSKRFIYYHLYKVAGTSVRRLLLPYCRKDIVVAQNLIYGLGLLGLSISSNPLHYFHPKLIDVRSIIPEEFESYYKFTFVRHPLDWQKSLYFFMRKNRRHHQYPLISVMAFPEYIRWRCTHELKTMTSLLTDPANGTLLVDKAFKFEELSSGVVELMEQFKLKGKLQHLNQAGRGEEVRLDRATADLFNESFKDDFLRFGYEKV